MKITAVLVLLFLILMPLFTRFILITAKLRKGEESLGKTIDPLKIKLYRRLAYIFIPIYFLLILSALFWVLSVFLSGTNIQNEIIIYSGILVFILFAVEGTIIFFALRKMRKINPLPEAIPDNKTILEWENRNADISVKYFWRFIFTLMGSCFAVMILVLIIIYIVHWRLNYI